MALLIASTRLYVYIAHKQLPLTNRALIWSFSYPQQVIGFLNFNVHVIIIGTVDVLGKQVNGLSSSRLNPQLRTKLCLLKMKLQKK